MLSDERPGSAGAVIVAVLMREVAQLWSAEPAVRADEPDAVHQMRVCTRRLRSLLRSYRPLFHRTEVDHLRTELRWLGAVLGAAREAEVRGDRLAAAIARLSKSHRATATARLVDPCRGEYAAALLRAVEELDGSRVESLRAALSDLVANPPLRERARRPAERMIQHLLGQEQWRLARLIEQAPVTDDDALHEVRKAAKRLRYAAEAARPTLGAPATTIGKRAKLIQTVLGDYRDAMETAATIPRETEYAEMISAETAAGQQALARYPAAIDGLTRLAL